MFQTVFNPATLIIASVTDQDGNPLYNPNFNKDFLALPLAEKKDLAAFALGSIPIA